MPGRRIQRLNEQLRREISEIVRFDVKDPRVGAAAISRVEATADLAHARVWVVVVGDDEAARETIEGLTAAAPYIRVQLSDRLEIRKVPALNFRVDTSMQHAARIEELLGSVQPPPADSGLPDDESADEEEA